MTEQDPAPNPKPTRMRRITAGELIALRLLLRSVGTGIKTALTAENVADRREALKVAQSQLNIAPELIQD